jgi:hypothetical protein
MKGGNYLLVAIEGPQSVVAVKDQKGLLSHGRGDLQKAKGRVSNLFEPLVEGGDQKTTNINPFYTIPVCEPFI